MQIFIARGAASADGRPSAPEMTGRELLEPYVAWIPAEGAPIEAASCGGVAAAHLEVSQQDQGREVARLQFERTVELAARGSAVAHGLQSGCLEITGGDRPWIQAG